VQPWPGARHPIKIAGIQPITMKMNKSVTLITLLFLSAGLALSPGFAAPGNSGQEKEAKGKQRAAHDMEAPMKDKEHDAKDRLAQFDLDGDGTISESERAAAGERYQRVKEAVENHKDDATGHADRMAKRDDMKASKLAIKDAGPEAKREAIAAMKEDKEGVKEAVKSGEMTKEEAKAAKKEEKKWWQFWKGGK